MNLSAAFGVRAAKRSTACDLRLSMRRYCDLGVSVHTADLQQPQFAGAFDWFAVQAPGGEVGGDRVAHAVVATVDPGKYLERLAGNEHLAAADDRAPRLVDDFGLNLVALILVGVQFLGDRRIDLDLHGAIRADRHFALGDDFWLRGRREIPRAATAAGSPTRASRGTKGNRRRTNRSQGHKANPTGRAGTSASSARCGGLCTSPWRCQPANRSSTWRGSWP